MRRNSGSGCARVGVLLLVSGLAVAAGCQPVREDRTITWSGQGDAVGFQHGKEGVFVADRDGGGLLKVFQPGDDVLATSPPLWAPAGGRLLFTTARAREGGTPALFPARGEPDPAGRVFVQQPVVYTCWLREAARDGDEPKPAALFEAACDHVGYVAANLAVRWHPKGDRVLYVKGVGPGRHGLFEFDLAARTSRQVFPRTAQALTFEWAPDGEHLVCALGSARRDPAADGLWIGRPGTDDWWHVPDSSALAEGELPSLLEQLRATQPAWAPDGARFAFASCTGPAARERPIRHFLCLGNLPAREVTVAAATGEPFRDLHWAPDGGRLGVVQGDSLRLLAGDGGVLSGPINRRPVQEFAGWQGDGEHLAYVVPDPVPTADGPAWAFLLVHDPLARDAVLVADGRGTEPGDDVLSGMRVTFPHWSPREGKLSLWATFSPTYRSLFSELLLRLPLGVRRGDPAAVFDVTTRRLGWMAVDAHEKAQVGHYYLLKRDYAEAWRWYEQAEAERPAEPGEPPPLTLANLEASLGGRDPAFFEWYCLSKLGRAVDAEARQARFFHTYLRLPEKDGDDPVLGTRVGERSLGQWLRDAVRPEKLLGALLRDLYMAEVFLSVDAAEDGERFFRARLDAAPTDAMRLSRALVLSQFLLLQKKHTAYVELATSTIAPLLFRVQRDVRPSGRPADMSLQALLDQAIVTADGLALLPLAAPEFQASLPEEEVRRALPRWQALAAAAQDDASRLEADLVLHAIYQRLGLEKEVHEVAGRLEQEAAAANFLPSAANVPALVEQLRQGQLFPPR